MGYAAPPGPPGHGPPGYGPPGRFEPPRGGYGYSPSAAGGSIALYSEKSRATAFLLAWLLGWCGADRFYLGQTGLGVLKLVTCGGGGLWWAIDMILQALGAVNDAQGKPLLPPISVDGVPTVNGNHVLLASVLAGVWGVDRFLLGQTGLGILKLCTCGGFGIWKAIDLVLIATGNVRDAQGNSLRWS